MKKYDVVLLTDARYEHPVSEDIYIQNILEDDRLVQKALEQRGLKVIRKGWASKDFDWRSTSYAVFRTTWDYFDRFHEFEVWLSDVEQETTLINSSKTIYWNMDKHYLQNLNDKGVNVIPTIYIEPHEKTTLQDLHQNTGWTHTILKPAISGGARHTYKLNLDKLASHEASFQKLILKESMLLQPFQNDVIQNGEVSHMLFNGKYTHSVLKKAKKGDFRVQDDFGGSVALYHPSEAEIAFATQAIQACNEMPTYARVDVIRDNNDELCLIELELIEPELWFRLYPESAEVFADAVVDFIKH